MMMTRLSLASLLVLLEPPQSTMGALLGTLPSAAFVSPTKPTSPHQLQQRWTHHLGGTTRYASTTPRHALHSGSFVTQSMCRAARQKERLQARQTAAVTRMSGAPGDEEQRGLDSRHSSAGGSGGGGRVFSELYRGVCTAIPVVPALVASCASAASAAEEAIIGDAGGGEMGARLDAPAAISFGAVVVAFAFLQARIRTAVKARTARRDYEKVVKDMENQRLVGGVDEEYVLRVGERMSELIREEQEARMVDIFGIPFNLVIPDGGGGNDSARGGGGATSTGQQVSGGREGAGAPSGEQLGIRETMRRKVEADKVAGKAREDEITPLSTLKVAALWLVLISQLWLLVVLWNDPMGPATSAFLKD